ncbi:hypothetical protein BGW80DRAFT_1398720 [Lactifluus volemus]|nr:hypothetical protein BGW80DRAFT_1398720 [Lactifluus volemus]
MGASSSCGSATRSLLPSLLHLWPGCHQSQKGPAWSNNRSCQHSKIGTQQRCALWEVHSGSTPTATATTSAPTAATAPISLQHDQFPLLRTMRYRHRCYSRPSSRRLLATTIAGPPCRPQRARHLRPQRQVDDLSTGQPFRRHSSVPLCPSQCMALVFHS